MRVLRRQIGRSLKILPKRILVAFWALVRLLYFKPAYLFLAIGVSIVFYELVFWFMNLGLFHYLLTTEFLSSGEKLSVAISSYSEAFTLPLHSITTVLFVVSLLQGAAVAGIVYSIKQNRSLSRGIVKEFGSTGVAGVLSVLGLGCIPCGTSLITPIIAVLFASSSAAVAEQVGAYSAFLALIISIITAYLTGSKVSLLH